MAEAQKKQNVLNRSVRLVMLQFSFSNPGAIPNGVKSRQPETIEERTARKSHASGVQFIEPVENCSLVEFLESDLDGAGYELVDAFYKPRSDQNGRTYHAVRFLFARKEHVVSCEKFKKVRDSLCDELRAMVEFAAWRVRGFLNSVYMNGEEIPDQCAISLNLEARKPLFRPDGQPVTVWQKDGEGNRLGDAPVPIRPDFVFRIKGDTVEFV